MKILQSIELLPVVRYGDELCYIVGARPMTRRSNTLETEGVYFDLRSIYSKPRLKLADYTDIPDYQVLHCKAEEESPRYPAISCGSSVRVLDFYA